MKQPQSGGKRGYYGIICRENSEKDGENGKTGNGKASVSYDAGDTEPGVCVGWKRVVSGNDIQIKEKNRSGDTGFRVPILLCRRKFWYNDRRNTAVSGAAV